MVKLLIYSRGWSRHHEGKVYCQRPHEPLNLESNPAGRACFYVYTTALYLHTEFVCYSV